jgi:hypothetical protein
MKKYSLILFAFAFLHLPLAAQWSDAYINDFKVNDDATTKTQGESRIGVDSAGNFVVAWNDRRNFADDQQNQVYCQIFDKWSNRIGNNFRVGQDTTYIIDIAVLKDGRFIVSWLNFATMFLGDRYEICYQRFNKIGIPISPILKVVDTSYSLSNQGWGGGGIGVDSTGKFVICWSNRPTISSIYPKVFFQRFDSSGNKIGIVDTVNELNTRSRYPSIAVKNDGSYVICWQDNRFNTTGNKFDIYMQRFLANGVRIGNNVKVNDDIDTTTDQNYSSISTDGNGKFAICWIDERIPSSTKVYYQLYDNSGNPIGPNKLASNTSSGFAIGIFPVCSMRKDGYFFIGWSNYDSFLGRRFDNLGNPYGTLSNNPYVVPINPPPSTLQACEDIFVLGDRVYSTWIDNRLGNIDIFCNIRGFQNPDTVVMAINNNHTFLNDFYLYEPYPNPFNPISTIKYDLPKESKVIIRMYDLLGREIKTLVNEVKQAGYHEAMFDGTNYASGLYIYRIEAGSFTDVKKMVLVK